MANIFEKIATNKTTVWIRDHGTHIAVACGIAIGIIGGGKLIFWPNPAPPPTFAELAQNLETDSGQGTEYFNSQAYQSITSLDSSNAGKLKVRLKEPNRNYLLTLLALRDVSRASYNSVRTTLKTGILVDALNEAKYSNSWGIPDRYWAGPGGSARALPDDSLEEPVEALLELDTLALAPLKALLTRERSLPRWGSGEGFQSEKQDYRVADYALAMIHRIKKGETYPSTREGRDALIQEYLNPADSTGNPR